MTPAGFPHSDISGSTPACDSPKLFAANHVLHRLLTPRHSPCALSSLVTNLKTIDASLLSLSRYAVYKVECFLHCETLNCPLTLDCKVVRACDSNELYSRHAFASSSLLRCQRSYPLGRYRLAAKGVNPIGIHILRQEPPGEWSVRGSNPRPPACKAGALPAELTPPEVSQLEWARKDLNFRPHAYQACALTN